MSPVYHLLLFSEQGRDMSSSEGLRGSLRKGDWLKKESLKLSSIIVYLQEEAIS